MTRTGLCVISAVWWIPMLVNPAIGQSPSASSVNEESQVDPRPSRAASTSDKSRKSEVRSSTSKVPKPTSRAVTLQITSADGTKLHGSLFKATKPKAGLLMVHGMQSHSGWFEASGLPAELARAGITCLAYDRRGSGRSSGMRGHTDSADQMLEDLHAGHLALVWALEQQGAQGVPIHVYANCYGTRIVLPYMATDPGCFSSVILTAPATDMSDAANYTRIQQAAILVAPARTYFASPLCDEMFVSHGPWLDWIHADPLSLRQFTAGFLRSTASLDRRMHHAISRLSTPALIVLGSQDAMVRNDKINYRFSREYRGQKKVVVLNGEHYLDFTDSHPALVKEIKNWVLSSAKTGTRGN